MPSPIVDFFQTLGDAIYQEWDRTSFDERRFPEIATRALAVSPPSASFAMGDVVDWIQNARQLRPQRDALSTFGQPSLTIYDAGRFFVDILFWADSTTSIHQHGFSGAFHVLAGSSLQVEYAFEAAERYSDRLAVGRLEIKSVEHLRAGDIRPIPTGTKLIHALFHLERPSISVVVRTGTDPFSGPQYSYLHCGIAFDALYAPDVVEKQVQMLGLLRTLGDPSLQARALAMVKGADAFRTFRIADAMANWLSPTEYGAFIDAMDPAHGGLLERLRSHQAERHRQSAIVERRKRIHRADHRFFLALLLNVRSRDRLFALVARAFPGASAEDTVSRWVRELSTLRHSDGRSALAVDLGEAELVAFDRLLRGATDEEVVRALDDEFASVSEHREQILELCSAFRSSTLFRLLLCA